MAKFEAVIFDMDGLLIDSMWHWIVSDTQFFGGFGIKLTDEMIKYFSGRSETESMSWAKEKFGLKETVKELLEKRKEQVDKIYTHHTALMPGVEELLKKIKAAGVKRAIASGAPIYQIKIVADRFNWHDYFSHYISPEHVGNVGKPNPAVYLHAAKVLEVDPKRCVVFEDAENGVIAAKEAGMCCVAVPDARWSPGDFSRADLVVNSLEDEKIFKFLNV